MNRQDTPIYEIEVTEGLETLAKRELVARLRLRPDQIREGRGSLRFSSSAELGKLTSLRLAESIFAVLTFDVPRPKALLGDQHFRRLVTAISRRVSESKPQPRTLELAAAGADSSVMLRLRQEIAKSTGLTDSEGKPADVQLRLLRARTGGGWDALLRLTPRPLSARDWRVCSFPGALNATVAHAMTQLTRPSSNQVVVNLMSGSGSLMIERLDQAIAKQMIGIELEHDRMDCARRNLDAAGLGDRAILLQADAQSVPLAAACADALCTDLPFGQRVGSHEANERVYPRVLTEAARLARSGALFAVLTHEVSLTEALLRRQTAWQIQQVLPLNLRGLHPRIYVLERA